MTTSQELNKAMILAALYSRLGFYPRQSKSVMEIIDENVINPPQSEESKQYYLKRAEAKRIRRRNG